ncbi:hypothetical protein K0U83_00545 [bacterium]|nr:hypothetical protein [bacterium]
MSFDLVFLMLAAPIALAFLVILPFDIISVLRGRGSIFDPPSIVVLNAQMDFMNTTIKTIAARKKDWVDNEHGLDTSAEKG